MSEPRLVAVDWSGRAGAEQRQTTWMAEAIEGELVRLEGASEDAFDAAVSALVMAAGVDELRALPDAPGYALDGKIWRPQRPPKGRWEWAVWPESHGLPIDNR